MTDVPPDDMVEGLAGRLDPYMRRLLDGSEDPHDVVGELMGTLADLPHFEHLWGVGWLYRIWGDLSDIVDAFPVDYGPDSEGIAIREYRHAAQGWLDMPRTLTGLEHYIERQRFRLASLSPSEPTTK